MAKNAFCEVTLSSTKSNQVIPESFLWQQNIHITYSVNFWGTQPKHVCLTVIKYVTIFFFCVAMLNCITYKLCICIDWDTVPSICSNLNEEKNLQEMIVVDEGELAVILILALYFFGIFSSRPPDHPVGVARTETMIWSLTGFSPCKNCQCNLQLKQDWNISTLTDKTDKHKSTYTGDVCVQGVGVIDWDWWGHCSGRELPQAEKERNRLLVVGCKYLPATRS